MLQQAQLISLLDRALNQTARIRKGVEAVYFCPFCSHYKKKLEVNVDTQEWHCWVCHARGKSLWSFFKKLQVNTSQIAELNKIIGTGIRKTDRDDDTPILALPDEFIPLSKSSTSFEYGHALSYLKQRGVTRNDILRYNIGYAERGEYRQRIIIPSYDKNGNINFFSARSYHDHPYKYMLPPWPKDIIGFELFINWAEPITLTEGQFDAIAVRKNVIPLFGTSLSFELKLAIVTHKVKRVNIVLDNDALKQAGDIYKKIEDLQASKIDTHLIKLGDKDPSVLGFQKVNRIINESKPFEFLDMVLLKMNT